MSPGGHLVITTIACAATAAATGSAALTAAVAAGGFFIDVDHAIDYVLFDGQRDLRPQAFLRYFLEGRVQRAVLVLHSYELFALLGAVAWWAQSPLLLAYLFGALMHLGLDIAFNGRVTPYSISAFYSFGYRMAHRFDARALLGMSVQRLEGGFWAQFFQGAPALEPLPETVVPRRTPASSSTS
ncbi:MAG: hypothetical protein FJ027_09600 [Candidatus Rokubacteria bacterium]|nr:hypothetical protein [Candidatus Rokubacteria bacterium]